MITRILRLWVRATIPDREDLHRYGECCQYWDNLDHSQIDKDIVRAVKQFRKSFYHDGTDKARKKFMKARSKLQEFFGET